MGTIRWHSAIGTSVRLSAVSTFLICIAQALVISAASAEESSLIAGQNINMVSGTRWPDGDPFLQRQNEPSIAVSSRNELNLFAGSNDYRTVDLPGLRDGKTIGDSWVSFYRSNTGGARWTSTLLPGYPQDPSELGQQSPLWQAGFEASADPVIRAGTHGLFYYSGIAFTRSEHSPSAGFVATFMDLNNDERKTSIGYVRTTLFDQNADGLSFIDKPWTAVDRPRGNATVKVLDVHKDDGEVIQQTVECGNVYVAYARIQGDGTKAVSSQIMFVHSTDCGATWSAPRELSLPGTINQGASVAVDPLSGDIFVAWRQFKNATLNCTQKANYWRNNPEAWPVDQIELADMLVTTEDAGKYISEVGDPYDDGDIEVAGDSEYSDDAERPTGVFRQLLAAWLNVLSGADPTAVEPRLEQTEAWLIENPPGTRPKFDVKRAGNDLRKFLRDFNKGKIGPGSCEELAGEDGDALLSGLNPDAIKVVKSTDGGATFSVPVDASDANYLPFEQGTTPFSFRTASYPTMTFDGEGRAYIAYATRGLAIPDSDPVGGDSRIVITASNNGANWTPAYAVDESQRPGHQFQPALTFSRGKLFLLYYDMREDISGVFDRFIVDLSEDPMVPRHSTDVRVAYADAGDMPVFTDYTVLDINPSTQTSRYPFMLFGDGATAFSQQMKYNPPNLPMFKGGTVPFFGDYIDIAALQFVKDSNGIWQFDIDPSAGAPVLHAVWTDNRDVIGPPDGDWESYVPPAYDVDGDGIPDPEPRESLFDPLKTVPACNPDETPSVVDRTKMRNQNIYTSRVTQGLAAAIPGNNRPLGEIQRVFVGFVQNTTDTDKTFRLKILTQPVGGKASFDQFAETPVTQIDEAIERLSSIARSIYVSSSDPDATINVRVTELGGDRLPIANGLAATMWINADASAPEPNADDILSEETYTPAIFNPAIFNENIFSTALLGEDEIGIFSPAIFNSSEYGEFLMAALTQQALLNPAIFNPAIFNPAIFNPAIFNPAIFNPAIFNPAIFNPAIFNPAIFNPAIFNVDVENPAIFNPAIFNPAIFNPAIFNTTMSDTTFVETSVVVENQGNATAAYSVNLDLEDPPEGFLYQLMVFRTYLTPIAEGCDLREQVIQEAIVNELMPDMNGNLLDPDSTTFYVAPGDHVVVSVRIVPDPFAPVPGDPSTIDSFTELDLSQSIVSQAVDTQGLADGETKPTPVYVWAPSATTLTIDTTSLPDGQAGKPYFASVSASGGDGSEITWSLAPGSVLPLGLMVDSNNRAITGTPISQGTYNFVLRAQDNDQVADRLLSIAISASLVDQSQPNIDTLAGNLTIDGDPVSGQKVAQVVTPLTASMGMLTEIRLPVWCPTGDLIIELQAVGLSNYLAPDGTVLSSQIIPNSSISNGPTNTLNNITLATSQPLLQTERFAIVLSSIGGTCAIQQGPLGDPYSYSSSYFDQAPFDPPTGWTRHVPRDDLPFETLVTPTNLNWRPNNNATDGVFAWSQTFGRTDNFSIRIQASSRSVTLSNPGWATLDTIPIDPTATYEASVWTYTPDGGVGHIPAIQMYLADGTFHGAIGATGPSGYTDPTGVWVQKSFTFRLADLPCCGSVARVRFIAVQDIEDFHSTGSPTTVFFDDAMLRTIAPVVGPNLVPRPSFDF